MRAALLNERSTSSTDRDMLELAVGYAAIMLSIWTPMPWTAVSLVLGLVWATSKVAASGVGISELGFRWSAVTRDYWVLPVAASIAVLGTFVAAHYKTLHPPFANTNPAVHAGEYLIWALVQQFILQNFLLTRLLRLLPTRSAAIVVAAGLFAAAHIPNLLLVVATLVWGVIACALFVHYRDLLTLGVAHALLGLSLAFTIPAPWHHQMRVGLGYVRWQPEPVQQSQADDSLHGGLPAAGCCAARSLR